MYVIPSKNMEFIRVIHNWITREKIDLQINAGVSHCSYLIHERPSPSREHHCFL